MQIERRSLASQGTSSTGLIQSASRVRFRIILIYSLPAQPATAVLNERAADGLSVVRQLCAVMRRRDKATSYAVRTCEIECYKCCKKYLFYLEFI